MRGTHCKKGHEYTLDNRLKDGRCGVCNRAQQLRYYHKNRGHLNEISRANQLNAYFKRIEKKYGLTREDYNYHYEGQEGQCAGCLVQLVIGYIMIDHNHRTGQVRGLLCQKCNCAIGLAQESPYVLEQLATYLRERGF